MDTITEERSVILSDGRVVQVRPGKGRDMLEAGRRAGVDVSRLPFEMAGLLASMDGQPLSFDTLMDMEMADLTAIMAAYGKSNFLASRPGICSTLPVSEA